MRLKVGETWCAQFSLSIACGLGIWAVFAKHQLCRGGPVLPLTHISGFWRDQIYNVRTSWGKPITEHELRHPEVLLWFSIPYILTWNRSKTEGAKRSLFVDMFHCGNLNTLKKNIRKPDSFKDTVQETERHMSFDVCLIAREVFTPLVSNCISAWLTLTCFFFAWGGGGI